MRFLRFYDILVEEIIVNSTISRIWRNVSVMKDLKQVVSYNITKLRKEKKLTQLELASALNYSDKAISKWERAESIPDIIVLKQLSDFFGVTIDYLITEHSDNENLIVIQKEEKAKINKISLTLLAASPIWLIATIIFSLTSIFTGKLVWYVFYISVPLTLLIILIFNSIWGNRRNNYIIVSCFIWSILFCIYLCFIKYNLWQLFILGIPGQVAIILWSTLKKN